MWQCRQFFLLSLIALILSFASLTHGASTISIATSDSPADTVTDVTTTDSTDTTEDTTGGTTEDTTDGTTLTPTYTSLFTTESNITTTLSNASTIEETTLQQISDLSSVTETTSPGEVTTSGETTLEQTTQEVITSGDEQKTEVIPTSQTQDLTTVTESTSLGEVTTLEDHLTTPQQTSQDGTTAPEEATNTEVLSISQTQDLTTVTSLNTTTGNVPDTTVEETTIQQASLDGSTTSKVPTTTSDIATSPVSKPESAVEAQTGSTVLSTLETFTADTSSVGTLTSAVEKTIISDDAITDETTLLKATEEETTTTQTPTTSEGETTPSASQVETIVKSQTTDEVLLTTEASVVSDGTSLTHTGTPLVQETSVTIIFETTPTENVLNLTEVQTTYSGTTQETDSTTGNTMVLSSLIPDATSAQEDISPATSTVDLPEAIMFPATQVTSTITSVGSTPDISAEDTTATQSSVTSNNGMTSEEATENVTNPILSTTISDIFTIAGEAFSVMPSSLEPSSEPTAGSTESKVSVLMDTGTTASDQTPTALSKEATTKVDTYETTESDDEDTKETTLNVVLPESTTQARNEVTNGQEEKTENTSLPALTNQGISQTTTRQDETSGTESDQMVYTSFPERTTERGTTATTAGTSLSYIPSSASVEYTTAGTTLSDIPSSTPLEYITTAGTTLSDIPSSAPVELKTTAGKTLSDIPSSASVEYTKTAGTTLSDMPSSTPVELKTTAGISLSDMPSSASVEYTKTAGTTLSDILSSASGEYTKTAGTTLSDMLSSAPVEMKTTAGKTLSDIPSSAPVEYTTARTTLSDIPSYSPSSAFVEYTKTAGTTLSDMPSSASVEYTTTAGTTLSDIPSSSSVEMKTTAGKALSDIPSSAPVEYTTAGTTLSDMPSSAPVEMKTTTGKRLSDIPSSAPVEYTTAGTTLSDMPSSAPVEMKTTTGKTLSDIHSSAPVEYTTAGTTLSDMPSSASVEYTTTAGTTLSDIPSSASVEYTTTAGITLSGMPSSTSVELKTTAGKALSDIPSSAPVEYTTAGTTLSDMPSSAPVEMKTTTGKTLSDIPSSAPVEYTTAGTTLSDMPSSAPVEMKTTTGKTLSDIPSSASVEYTTTAGTTLSGMPSSTSVELKKTSGISLLDMPSSVSVELKTTSGISLLDMPSSASVEYTTAGTTLSDMPSSASVEYTTTAGTTLSGMPSSTSVELETTSGISLLDIPSSVSVELKTTSGISLLDMPSSASVEYTTAGTTLSDMPSSAPVELTTTAGKTLSDITSSAPVEYTTAGTTLSDMPSSTPVELKTTAEISLLDMPSSASVEYTTTAGTTLSGMPSSTSVELKTTAGKTLSDIPSSAPVEYTTAGTTLSDIPSSAPVELTTTAGKTLSDIPSSAPVEYTTAGTTLSDIPSSAHVELKTTAGMTLSDIPPSTSVEYRTTAGKTLSDIPSSASVEYRTTAGTTLSDIPSSAHVELKTTAGMTLSDIPPSTSVEYTTTAGATLSAISLSALNVGSTNMMSTSETSVLQRFSTVPLKIDLSTQSPRVTSSDNASSSKTPDITTTHSSEEDTAMITEETTSVFPDLSVTMDVTTTKVVSKVFPVVGTAVASDTTPMKFPTSTLKATTVVMAGTTVAAGATQAEVTTAVPGSETTVAQTTEVPDLVDQCASGLCQNGGVCLDGYFSYSCDCGLYYTGANCESVIPSGDLYPYGADEGDNEVVGSGFGTGTLSSKIKWNNFVMYGQEYRNARVSRNGYVVFNNKLKLNYPKKFPIVFNDAKMQRVNAKGIAVFAPLLASNDQRLGQVYYQQYDVTANGNNQGNAVKLQRVLDMASFDVARFGGLRDFTATEVLVATWENMAPSTSDLASVANQNNTYQLVLISNGFLQQTYAVFIYKTLLWSQSAGWPNEVGWYTQKNYQTTVLEQSLSNTPQAYKLDTLEGNVGITGRWLYQLFTEAPVVYNYAQLCYNWEAEQAASVATTNLLKARYGFLSFLRPAPCPCDLIQAIFDWRYYPFTLDASKMCFVEVFSLGTWAQSCCYDREFGVLLLTADGQGGNLYLYHPLWYFNQWEVEQQDKSYCCVQSNNCERYYALRPVDDCSRYIAPVLAWAMGDPHISTLDGKRYTFNGLGEFLLVQTDDFTLQGRTKLVRLNNGTLSDRGTVWGGYAAHENGSSVIVVLLNDNRDDGHNLTSDFYALDVGKVIYQTSVSLKKDDVNNTLAVLFSSGFAISMTLGSGQLDSVISAPSTAENKTKGLLGVFNGNQDDDFTLPDDHILPTNITDRQIFSEFGMKWQINSSESRFLYFPPEDYSTFNPANFVPQFEPVFLSVAVETAAKAACGDNKACLFDAAAANDPDFGAATLNTELKNQETSAVLSNSVPILSGPHNVNVTIGEVFNITVSATDVDGDNVTVYMPFGVPYGATFTNTTASNTAILTWTPSTLDGVNITFYGTDNNGGQAPELSVAVSVCNCSQGQGDCLFLSPRIDLLYTSTFSVATCDCYTGYGGDFCEEETDGCADSPCFSGTNCTDLSPAEEVALSRTYNCSECPTGYTGSGIDCQDINECEMRNDTCDQLCENTVGSYICKCRLGYELQGNTCADLDECVLETSDCAQICTNTNGSFVCSCLYGYALEADGKTCGQVLDICAIANLTCSYGCANETGNITCLCPHGYELDVSGVNCTDIDECASNATNICGPNAACNNTAGGYVCNCQDGYQTNNDGRTCSDCPTRTFGPNCIHLCSCLNSTTYCDKVTGCAQCSAGWEGPSCHLNIDECLNNPCGANSNCTDTPGFYKCECSAGYTQESLTSCIDIDECASAPCQNNGHCSNYLNYYNCTCAAGYNGTNCETNIDDCDPSPCQNNGQCTDLVNTYKCVCATGYTGTDCETKIPPQKISVTGSALILNETFVTELADLLSVQSISLANRFIAGISPGIIAVVTNASFVEVTTVLFQNQSTTDLAETNNGDATHVIFSVILYESVEANVTNILQQYFMRELVKNRTLGNLELLYIVFGDNGCVREPCGDNGACSPAPDSTFSCECLNQYTGMVCQSPPPPPCQSVPCGLNGNCTEVGNTNYTCTCLNGYSGDDCEVPPDSCWALPCGDFGNCTVLNATEFSCTCFSGYVGKYCQVAPATAISSSDSVYEARITFTTPYDPNLANTSSAEYNKVVSDIKPVLDAAFQAKYPEFKDTTNYKFEIGSTITLFDVLLSPSVVTTQTDVLNVINSAVISNYLAAIYPVQAGSIEAYVIAGGVISAANNTGLGETETTGIIAGSVLAGIFLVFVITSTCLILYSQRKKIDEWDESSLSYSSSSCSTRSSPVSSRRCYLPGSTYLHKYWNNPSNRIHHRYWHQPSSKFLARRWDTDMPIRRMEHNKGVSPRSWGHSLVRPMSVSNHYVGSLMGLRRPPRQPLGPQCYKRALPASYVWKHQGPRMWPYRYLRPASPAGPQQNPPPLMNNSRRPRINGLTDASHCKPAVEWQWQEQ